MAASANDKFMYVGSPGTATTLSSPGYTTGVSTSITVGTTASFPTLTGTLFAIDTVEVVTTNGVAEEVQVAGTYCVFSGVVTNGTTISSLNLLYGTAQSYAAGALTRVYIPISSLHTERLIQGLLAEHDQLDGTHGAITPTSVVTPSLTATTATITTATITNLTVGSQTPSADWTASVAPNTVTANGNRSYTMVFNATDLTSAVNPGTRLRTTRTVAAPTQSTSLNGTTQYWSKTSPNKLTFTDDFVVSAWVKLSSYPSSIGTIMSRFNGTSGWRLSVSSTGQVSLTGFNAGGANFSYGISYQSVPLNKWVHVAAQLDMSAFTATTTTSYIMIDGVDVPIQVLRGGTNPTALVQAGNLEIGTDNATNFFPGKIAQTAIFNAKVTQATIQGYISQGLTGSETSLASAYSFNGVATDLMTTTPNDLTANGSAVATNADSPFGTQASGLISSTLDYGIVQSCTFSTNTTMVVQVPEGCTIPTSGGVSAVSYSSVKAPYGFPSQKGKWQILTFLNSEQAQAAASGGTIYNVGGCRLTIPAGSWSLSYSGSLIIIGSASVLSGDAGLSTTTNTYSELPSVGATSYTSANSTYTEDQVEGEAEASVASSTIYYLNARGRSGTVSALSWGHPTRAIPTSIRATNAYL